MANLNLQVIDADGSIPAYAAAASGGDALEVADTAFAHFRNHSTSAITVTLVTPGTVRGLAIADATLSVPANGDAMVALDRQLYAGTNGRATVTYSATTKSATVSNKALTANVATLTTSAAHNLLVGESVTVTGVDATFNGTYTVASVPSPTTFTYAKTAADVASVAATGTVTAAALSVAVLARG